MHCNVMNYNEILEIAWDVIVLGGNKHFPGSVRYRGAIFLVAIIWGTYQ